MAITHGVSGYTTGCRCDTCTGEWRIYRRKYAREWQRGKGQHRTVPAQQLTRLLDTLRGHGITPKNVGEMLGINPSRFYKAYGQERVSRSMVATVYALLEVVRQRGNGILSCGICGKATADHALTERCYSIQ